MLSIVYTLVLEYFKAGRQINAEISNTRQLPPVTFKTIPHWQPTASIAARNDIRKVSIRR